MLLRDVSNLQVNPLTASNRFQPKRGEPLPFFHFIMRLSRYIKIYPYAEKPGHFLLYSTRQSSVALLNEDTLKAAQEGTLSPASRETLHRLGFLIPHGHDERREMLALFDRADHGRPFNAVLVLNLDCNLDCTYCFEGGMKGNRYMTRETADLFIDFAEKNYLAEGKSVELDFYGGEPLLSVDLIRYVSGRLKPLVENRGGEYTFNLVTNGTLLTGELARELAPLGLRRAKVTIDGPQEIHDAFRPFVSGAGSFDAIVRNVKAVCDVIGIQFTGNYTRENYQEFPRLLDHILAEGITPDKLAMVMFAPVTGTMAEYGLPEYREGCDSTEEPWLIEASLFLRQEILKRGFYTPKMRPSSCMVEFSDNIIVGFDGTIYKCPAFIGRKEFAVGDLHTGIRDYHDSHKMDLWKNDECLDCAYLPICFGGCRFLKLLRDGAIDGVDCRKDYLDAALESYILQDLKLRTTAEKP